MVSVLNAIVPLQTNGNGIIEPLAVLAVTIVIFAGFWKTFDTVVGKYFPI
jgi:hypothetical protein